MESQERARQKKFETSHVETSKSGYPGIERSPSKSVFITQKFIFEFSKQKRNSNAQNTLNPIVQCSGSSDVIASKNVAHCICNLQQKFHPFVVFNVNRKCHHFTRLQLQGQGC